MGAVAILLSVVTLILSLALSISIFISGVASVMKLYELIEDTWFMIWEVPLYIFMFWLSLTVFGALWKLNQKEY